MISNPGNNWSDQELIKKVLGGDTHAFGIIIKNTERLVAGIVYKMVGNAEDRKDLAQDIYVKAYRKLPSFKFQSKLSTWIGQISYNTCLDHLRKKKLILPGDLTDEKESIDDGIPDTGFYRKELSGILNKAIQKLSPVFRTLITLYHNEGLGYEEIGQITGLPEGTVKSYLFRARKALKNNLLLNYKKEEL